MIDETIDVTDNACGSATAPPSITGPEFPDSQEAVDRFDEIVRKSGRNSKPPKHPKYAFRTIIQASRELRGSTKLVALLLVDFVNVEDGYAYPTVKEIMDKLGMTETTVHRALKNLQDLKAKDPITGVEAVVAPGWFRRVSTKMKNGADGRNHWYPIYARAGVLEGDRGGCQNDRGGCQNRHPLVPNAEPHILTGYELDSVKGGELATLGPSNESGIKNPHNSAAAQLRGPGLAALKKDRPKASCQPVQLVALPDGSPFDPEDVAKRSDLTADDIAAAESSFRKTVAGDVRTPADWKKNAGSWLLRQKPVTVQPSTIGTLLPNPFIPDDAIVKVARDLGFSHSNFYKECEKFCRYYRSVCGQKSLSRNWQLNLHSWFENEANRKTQKNGKTQKSAGMSGAV